MEKKYSTAQKFVDDLINEGGKIPCDETSESFKNHKELPHFYDEDLYRKGQKFFYKNIFGFFFSNCLGLIAVLAIPSILKILIFTKMSSTSVTAYKRYVATIFHMMVWYDSDFKPGSRLWRSIAEVRSKHNSASRRGCSAGFAGITQKDMALTQFGFMGIALVRSKKIGIYHATEDDWKAFLHLWRVVGYLMGIENRFNICSGTVEETREICNLLIEQVFRPYVEQKDKNFLSMSYYMLNGLWAMNPVINYKSMLCYLHDVILQTDYNNDKPVTPSYVEVNFSENFSFYTLVYGMYMMERHWFRVIQNYIKILSLWLMKVFPFLAFYQHGISNSYVYILDDNKR